MASSIFSSGCCLSVISVSTLGIALAGAGSAGGVGEWILTGISLSERFEREVLLLQVGTIATRDRRQPETTPAFIRSHEAAAHCLDLGFNQTAEIHPQQSVEIELGTQRPGCVRRRRKSEAFVE